MGVKNILQKNAERLGISQGESSDVVDRFPDLLTYGYKKYEQRLVVLVDEHDKPILDNIDTPEIAAEVREGLKNIYSILKEQDAHIQFIVMTGVSKFSKVSLFHSIPQFHQQ